MLPEVDLDAPINPQVLWSREDLSMVLSEKKLQNGYDEKFRRNLMKYGMPTKYKEPNIEVIQDFMFDIRDMYLILISQKKNQQNFNEEMQRL